MTPHGSSTAKGQDEEHDEQDENHEPPRCNAHAHGANGVDERGLRRRKRLDCPSEEIAARGEDGATAEPCAHAPADDQPRAEHPTEDGVRMITKHRSNLAAYSVLELQQGYAVEPRGGRADRVSLTGSLVFASRSAARYLSRRPGS